MEQRLSLVTLAVKDVEAAAEFYERLGWRRHRTSVAGNVAFFQLSGSALALFDRKGLMDDAGVPEGAAGPAATFSLAQNLRDRESVDRVFSEAILAGASEVKRPVETFWGGYAGYFADPDGHLWEVAHNPFWQIDASGNVSLG